jgi:hypothetical protein
MVPRERSERVPPVCQICGESRSAELHRSVIVRPAVAELIRKENGAWSTDGWICRDDLQRFRRTYVASLLHAEKAELEIRQLHQKIDHLLGHQWERLVEIQQIQLDLLDEVRQQKSSVDATTPRTPTSDSAPPG